MDQKGQALVEASMIIGLLSLLIMAAVELEKAGNMRIAFQMAARYGARVATLKRSSPEKKVVQMLQEMLPSLDTQKVKVRTDRNGMITTMRIEAAMAGSYLTSGDRVIKASAAMARPILGWY